ncbi:hypothetical protein D3C86_2038260 [compost metagenome]
MISDVPRGELRQPRAHGGDHGVADFSQHLHVTQGERVVRTGAVPVVEGQGLLEGHLVLASRVYRQHERAVVHHVIATHLP